MPLRSRFSIITSLLPLYIIWPDWISCKALQTLGLHLLQMYHFDTSYVEGSSRLHYTNMFTRYYSNTGQHHINSRTTLLTKTFNYIQYIWLTFNWHSIVFDFGFYIRWGHCIAFVKKQQGMCHFFLHTLFQFGLTLAPIQNTGQINASSINIEVIRTVYY